MSRSRYSSEELHDINLQNANRLPPASAVLGMATYEYQRAAEHERLFHAAIFDAAQLRKTTASQQLQIDSLQRAVNACASHHDNDRSVTLTGVRSIQDALKSFTPTDTEPQAVIKRSTWLMNELDQEAISTEDQVALTTVITSDCIHEAKMELQQAVQQVRDDHLSTIANDLLEAKIRISKLEDLVRVLTAQKTEAQTLPKMAQELDAITRYGRAVVLKIPKGQALVPLRSSRSRTPMPSTANSVTSSQPTDESMAIDSGDVSTSSQSTAEIATQPTKSKVEIMEKPLPPVPAQSAAYLKSSSADSKDLTSFRTSPWDVSTLSLAPPVHVTPRVDEQMISIPKSKGKGKAKKWTDPPIFHENQVTKKEDQTKTLFSFHDHVEAPSSVRTGTHEHDQNKNVSPVRSVTNQMMATKPLEVKQEPSTVAAALSKKRSLGEVLGHHENKPGNENQPQLAKPTKVNPQTPVLSSDAMKDMLRAVAPKSNYVTSASANPKAPSANEELAAPRAPLGSITVPYVPDRTASPSPSNISKRSNLGKIAKGSVIKRVDEAISRPQMSPSAPNFQPSAPLSTNPSLTAVQPILESSLAALLDMMTPEARARFTEQLSRV